MSPVVAWLTVGGGIIMLGVGASWLVDGASRLALRLGVTPMVVGLTVVGFGTSMPEFSVSVLAAGRGSGGLSIGNAVGSNVMNLLLVLGVAALMRPITVVGSKRNLLRDLLFGLAPAIVLLPMASDGEIDRVPALTLIAVFVAFMATCLAQTRKRSAERTVVSGSVRWHATLTLVGIAVLVIGAELMVRGGTSVARSFGVSDAVIGLTLVAFGTSLPELATSVMAAIKGQAELSVGNVLGSNVFNLGLIVGTAFTIRPGPVPAYVIRQDVPFLMLATAVVGLLVLKDGRIGRGRGTTMLVVFAVYATLVLVRGG